MFKAKLTAQILKDALEGILYKTPSEQDPAGALGEVLDSMKNTGLIDHAFIYSKSGDIIISTDPLAKGKKASGQDFLKISSAIENKVQEKTFVSYLDKATRTLQLYIPISSGNREYVARTDISLGNIFDAAKQVYIPVIFTTFVVIITTIAFGVVLSKKIIGPILLLNTATKEVAAGDLNLRIHINTNDELEDLAETFNIMAIELKKMKAKAENANPLTKLPGNIVIQEEVEKCIKDNRRFTVLYCDLDNFKAYNDNYGIYAGDKVIKLCASILLEAVTQKGSPDDFVGHEGGDDFIILTTSVQKAKDISDYIIPQFASRIRGLYKKEDLDRGYIAAKARHGDEILKFPIMTISVAGVTNEIRPIYSYGEVTNIAAEVKKKAKATQGSCLVIDQRRAPWPYEPLPSL
jgi:diguanylate cyclase (GGDEF)-like protein